jgi:2-polyprenyl-6-methoxyphenol hydroxylase-like FAD-dependent oxidoreductase
MGSIDAQEPVMYPVVIVGGGPVGLTTSIQLSQLKIPHILFERHSSTARVPKAIESHSRTVEIWRRMGLEPILKQHRAGPEIVGRTGWYTSFGPEGKEIISRDSWGGNQYAEEYAAVSPCRFTWIPQIRLEPLLRTEAIKLNPDGIHYGHDVTKVAEVDDHVLITYQIKDSEPRTVKAQYCIGADGGRTVAGQVGLKWEGHPNVIDMVSAHIRAPMSTHHPDIRNFITWFVNPRLGGTIGSGYLYHLGPYPIKPETEEWYFGCGVAPHEKEMDDAAMQKRMQATLQIPDFKAELLSKTYWHVDALTAERFRSNPSSGRVFLVGDAAHRVPPWGALGLNTGIQDLDNLLWKLNFMIKGLPSSLGKPDLGSLLDTYDTERRPICQRVRDLALHNLGALGLVMDNSIGVSMTNTPNTNVANMDSYFNTASSNIDGAERREAVKRAATILDDEFRALGMEHGWFYPDLDFDNEGGKNNHDGQLRDDGEFEIHYYRPSTIPGHHLPHAWLQGGGKRVSTRDLVRYEGFVLLISRVGLWEKAVREEGHGIVTMEVIVSVDIEKEGDKVWKDVDGQWAKVRGVAETGAVLVRPDGIVSWRAKMFDQEKHGKAGWLDRVLRKSLCLL